MIGIASYERRGPYIRNTPTTRVLSKRMPITMSVLIDNQPVPGFKTADGFVFGPMEEQPHNSAAVRFGQESAVGTVEPDELLFIEQGAEDLSVTIIFRNSRQFEYIR